MASSNESPDLVKPEALDKLDRLGQLDESPAATADFVPDFVTVSLALQDMRAVLVQQQQLRQLSFTQLNILFVVNTALLSVLSFSKLIFSRSWFSLIEIVGFSLSFSLLIFALLPRTQSVTPNPDNLEIAESLAKSANDYQLQMLSNFQEVYRTNQQRIDDITQALLVASLTLWATVIVALLHILSVIFSQ